MKLTLLATAAILSISAFHTLKWLSPAGPDLLVKEAVERYLGASEALALARDKAIDEELRAELSIADPRSTGLVGVLWSSYTTTSGDLAAKRLSTSPEWVRAYIQWFRSLGLEPGDRIAIGASGSFPALLLSARVAAETYGLEPVIVASLTSSTYGANVPGFDLWDMETVLLEGGFVKHPIHALTIGGDGDRALHMEEEDREFLFTRLAEIERQAPGLIVPRVSNTSESISRRLAIFFPGDQDCVLFINIGGHAANLGSGLGAISTPRGLSIPSRRGTESFSHESVLRHALSRGVPTINLLDIRGVAGETGVSPNFESTVTASPSEPGLITRLTALGLAICLLGALRLTQTSQSPSDWRHLITEKVHK